MTIPGFSHTKVRAIPTMSIKMGFLRHSRLFSVCIFTSMSYYGAYCLDIVGLQAMMDRGMTSNTQRSTQGPQSVKSSSGFSTLFPKRPISVHVPYKWSERSENNSTRKRCTSIRTRDQQRYTHAWVSCTSCSNHVHVNKIPVFTFQS